MTGQSYQVCPQQLAGFREKILASAHYQLSGDLTQGVIRTRVPLVGEVSISYRYADGTLQLEVAAPEAVRSLILDMISKYLSPAGSAAEASKPATAAAVADSAANAQAAPTPALTAAANSIPEMLTSQEV